MPFLEDKHFFQYFCFLIWSWKRACTFYANVLSQKLRWHRHLPHPQPLFLTPRQWRKMVSLWPHQRLSCLHLLSQRSRMRGSRQSSSSNMRRIKKNVRRSSSPHLLLGQKSCWRPQNHHRTQQQVIRVFFWPGCSMTYYIYRLLWFNRIIWLYFIFREHGWKCLHGHDLEHGYE